MSYNNPKRKKAKLSMSYGGSKMSLDDRLDILSDQIKSSRNIETEDKTIRVISGRNTVIPKAN